MISKIEHKPILNNFIDIPKAYLCPISETIMMEPVILEDGHSYEKEQIDQWFKHHTTSPMTGLDVNKGVIIPNRNLQSEISDFLSRHPSIHDSDATYMPSIWVSHLVDALKQNKQGEAQKLLDKDKRLLTCSLEGSYTAWHLAAQYGSTELTHFVLKKLLQYQLINTLKEKETPDGFEAKYIQPLLALSLEEIDNTLYSGLLQLGANPERIDPDSGDALLHLMIEKGNLNAVKWLLDTPVNIMQVNQVGNTPLHCAVLQGRADIVELLLSYGATCIKNYHRQTPVALAVLNQKTEILSYFLNETERTLPPLNLSLMLDDEDLFEALLNHSPLEIDAQDSTGRTALYIAIEKKKSNAINALLAKGVDPYVVCGKVGESPLHLAIKYRDKKLVENLLSVRVNTKVQDKDGNTPLHLAVKQEDDTLVDLLLRAGFDPCLRNYAGMTPMDLGETTQGTLSQRFHFFQQVNIPNTLFGHTDIVYCLEKLDNGEFASGSWDKTIKIWKAERCIMTLKGHNHNVICLQKMGDNFIASGSSDKTIKLWDLKTQRCIDTLSEHLGTIRCLQRLSPGYLASGSSDKTIKLWDLDLKKCVKTLQGHTDSINALTLCANGQLASGSWDNCIKIWNVQTGSCVQTLKGHTGVVRCLLPLANGQLISGSRDKTIKIWDITRGTCLATLTGHTDSVNCLYLWEDRYLCSGAWDKTIRVWDLFTNKLVNTCEGHTGAVNSFILGENGMLLSSSDDKSIKTWPSATLLPRENNYSLFK